jgi:hypothetical protein
MSEITPSELTNEEIMERFKIRQCCNFHPYTCMGQTNDGEICNRSDHDWGEYVAVERDGKVRVECPCGKSWEEVPSEIFDEKKMELFKSIHSKDSLENIISNTKTISYDDVLKRKLERENQ